MEAKGFVGVNALIHFQQNQIDRKSIKWFLKS